MIMKIFPNSAGICLAFWVFVLNIILLDANGANAGNEGNTPEKPLWEAGVIPGVLRMPHYRGSDEYDIWALPLPYVIYMGKFFQFDREGAHGIFYRSEYLQTSISGWGNPPVNEDNKAREGMDNPDAIVEFGPSLQWHFRGRSPFRTLYLRWALRSAISVGFPDNGEIDYRGLKSAINLVYRKEAFWNDHHWELGVNSGIEMADRNYHDYLYKVSVKDVTPERPAYSPDTGISALMFSLRLIRKINDRVSVAGYARWENMSLAVYKESPLVKEENNWIAGCALVWTLKESKTSVHSE